MSATSECSFYSAAASVAMLKRCITYHRVRLSFRLFVCPSCAACVKTTQARIAVLPLSDSPILLVSGTGNIILKFDWSHLEGSRFRGQILAITRNTSETVRDSTTVTIDYQWEVVYGLSIGTSIDG